MSIIFIKKIILAMEIYQYVWYNNVIRKKGGQKNVCTKPEQR